MMSQFSLLQTSRLLLLPTVFFLILVVGDFRPVCARAGDEDWRPVSPSELAMKAPLVEADADAEAIFWDIRIDDHGDKDLVMSHYIRIKIFTKRGRENNSRFDIPFLTGTKIKDVAARTIKPDGSVIEMAKGDVIERTIVKISGLKLQSIGFAFPGVEIGSIIEYKWKEAVSNVSANNMRLQFQLEIPAQSITYHIKPADKSTSFNVRSYRMMAPEFQKEKDGFQFITVTNVSAFNEEPMMPPEDSVRSWAIIMYRSLFSSLVDYSLMARRINYLMQPQLKPDDAIKRKSDQIVAGANSPKEKLDRIFAFCRANIRNTSDKSYGHTAEDNAKLKENIMPADTLIRGVGPRGDINLLFAALVGAAGFEARVTLLPDRGKSFFDKNAVIPGALQLSNIAVRVNDKWEFFDPGLLYITPGMLRWQEEGVEALIASENPKWVMTPVSAPEKSRETRTATLRLDENGNLEGEVSIVYTGHLSVEKKLLNDDLTPTQREETLKEAVNARISAAELTNIVIENATDPSRPFTYRYHIRVPGYAQRTGKRLFLQPAFFQKDVGPLFTSSRRRFPIYFHFPWSEEDKVTISLPKGYTIDNAESPAPFAAGDVSRYEVKMGVSKDGTTLHFQRSFFFGANNTLLFPADTYEHIRKLFDDLNKRDNQTITLRPGTQAAGSASILPAPSAVRRVNVSYVQPSTKIKKRE